MRLSQRRGGGAGQGHQGEVIFFYFLSAACSTNHLVCRDSDSQGGRGDDRAGWEVRGQRAINTDWKLNFKVSSSGYRLSTVWAK